ncbi:MAG: T9SS type A sorting domain-containing protein, partial [Ignavibacterium sp.]|nr:T9SS type A sorting domain-containing protein [Ignavibacterium sp.]
NEVATVVNEFREAGRYEIEFNASELSSGIYYYKLKYGNQSIIKKMILLK